MVASPIITEAQLRRPGNSSKGLGKPVKDTATTILSPLNQDVQPTSLKNNHFTHSSTQSEPQSNELISSLALSAITRNNKSQQQSNSHFTVLGTAVFRIKDSSGRWIGPIRAMCDSGSQVNLITNDCVRRLDLPRKATQSSIIGAGIGSQITASGVVDAQIGHRSEPELGAAARFLIIPKISCHHPQQQFTCELGQQLPTHQLADPDFTIPERIDALIGVGTWTTILRNGFLRIDNEQWQLVAQNSALGWVISGKINGVSMGSSISCHVASSSDALLIDLKQFWDVKDSPNNHALTRDQQWVEKNFTRTVQRDPSGRYQVTIPIRPDVPPLGLSRRTALERLHAIEAKMKRRPDLADKCRVFMKDYIDSGDMVLAGKAPSDPSQSYYIPYHMIHDKKFRVVFDGSRPSSTGISFNDQQLPGPKLQADLGETLLQFRMNPFGLTADVSKMFRQVKVSPAQWNFQRILWRESPDDPIREYVITCVVWGFTSATFNAVRAMRQCAVDHGVDFPIAAHAVLSHFYVDDLLAGGNSYAGLVLLRNQLTNMLRLGGFELAKWTTSNPQLAKEIGQSNEKEVDLQAISGVLGMVWCPAVDSIRIRLNIHDNPKGERFTKRQIISQISKLYDPSGLYAPSILEGKVIIQDIWREEIDWHH